MSSTEFEKFSVMIYARLGIQLPPAKKSMLEGRLAKRLRALEMYSYQKYYDYICSSEGQTWELQKMINCITTNKTDFFREPKHFERLTSEILPKIVTKGKNEDGRQLNIWSAGCSTGEEPYTLAMVVNEFCERHLGWTYSLLATDISTHVLQKAAQGVFSSDQIEPISMYLRKKYLLRSKNRAEDAVRIVPGLRSKVNFKQLNFMDRSFEVNAMMDVIFCRNVLIYFDRNTQEQVLNRLCHCLKPDGYLFLGHSETIQGYRVPLKTWETTIYRKSFSVNTFISCRR